MKHGGSIESLRRNDGPTIVTYFLSRLRPGGCFSLVTNRIRRLQDVYGEAIAPQVCACLPTRAKDGPAIASILREWHDRSVPTYVLGHTGLGTMPRTLYRLMTVMRRTDVAHVLNAPFSYTAFAAYVARTSLLLEWVSSSVEGARAGRGGRLVSVIACATASANVAVSQAVADAVPLKKRLHILSPPLPMAPRSITVAADVSAMVSHRYPVVLVVSRLAPLKGVGHLPDIIAGVVDIYPDAMFLIAGDGPLRPTLMADIRRVGVERNVSVLGFRHDIYALHAVADVYVAASDAEGLVGYATLEAIIAGTPVVASDIPSVREVLRQGRDAELVPPGEIGGYVRAIEHIASDSRKRDWMVESARARVLSMLNSTGSLADLAALYRCLS